MHRPRRQGPAGGGDSERAGRPSRPDRPTRPQEPRSYHAGGGSTTYIATLLELFMPVVIVRERAGETDATLSRGRAVEGEPLPA